MNSMKNGEFAPYIKVGIIGFSIAIILTVLVLVHYTRISKRSGTLVIPAGNTYLGPNAPKQGGDAPSDSSWREVKGNIYAYSMSVPASLTLVTFPRDPYDIYAISCCNVDPGANVLIGVENLNNKPTLTQYIKGSKRLYVQNWWQQFSGLKSVTSIETFTNSKGLKGYKAKYVNAAGETPNLDVFFEVPGKPELIIHMASGTLEPDVFEKIIDSVGWQK